MQSNRRVGFRTSLHNRIPVASEQRGESNILRTLRERYRNEATSSISTNFGSTLFGIGQKRQAQRNYAIFRWLPPFLVQPVVPCLGRGVTKIEVIDLRKYSTAETSDHRREIHRGPDTVDVHVSNAFIDIPTALAHV